MSVSTDEDVFTYLTEDFEIPCDSGDESCDSAKYVAIKKCCALQLLLCQYCVDYLHSHKITFRNCQCADCYAIFHPGVFFAELFIFNPL